MTSYYSWISCTDRQQQRPVGLCVKSQDDKWHPMKLSKLCSLPGCACEEPWAPGPQQCFPAASSRISQQNHPTKTGPVSLSSFRNPSLNVTCVYMIWENEWPWLGWGIFLTQALTLGSPGTTGNLEEKNHLSYSFYSSSSQIKST